MNKILILIVIVFSNFVLNAADNDTIKANNPLIEYTGRIDFSAPLAPRFSYSGVSVRACFQGTSLSFILNDPESQNYYNVILDNSIVSRIQTKAGLNSYSVASGLNDTIHEIEIFRLTEEMFGKTQFRGFIIDKGKTLVEISNVRNHLIEFIGNSITCGYGNEGINGQGSFGPTTENHYLTYAAITSQSFNARHLAVCKSGIGIYRNYDGPVTGSNDCMTNYYLRTFLYDSAPLYSFKDKPDLVCINLGTNDFSTDKGDSAKFVSKYLQFLDTIQLKNNGADILCLMGPMISGTTLTRIRTYLNFIADSTKKKNKGNVYLFEMSQQTGSLGIGIDYHPTVAQHLKNARELAKYISKLKGWQIVPKVIFGSISSGDEIVLNFNSELIDTSGSFNGFSVIADSVTIPVASAKPDPADKSKMRLLLSMPLLSGQKTEVSYSPGTIAGKDSFKLEEIHSFNIQNQLKETKLVNATIDASGAKVTLTFNKNILGQIDLQGILIYDSNNTILEVANFKTVATTLNIILREKVKTGDSYYLTIVSKIITPDKVVVTPVTAFSIKNNSTYTSVEVKNKAKLNLYPNPSLNKIVNYRIEENFRERIILHLFDLQGKLIVSKELDNGIGIIDFNSSSIHSGSYILKYSISDKGYSTLIVL